MPLERAALERFLLQLGFQPTESGHREYTLRIQGRLIAKTSVSRGTVYRTISDELVAQIARQLHVNRRFLIDLVEGSRSREDYFERLRDQGLL